MAGKGMWERVFVEVRAIPPGKVMTYGQISDRLRGRISAAAVGWALNVCPDDVPWQRVVNARGGCSTDSRGEPGRQRNLLEREGVKFQKDGHIDLEAFRWEPERV